MRKADFENLKESIRQAAAISRGEMEPARRTVYSPEEVAAIRAGRKEEVIAARIGRKPKTAAGAAGRAREIVVAKLGKTPLSGARPPEARLPEAPAIKNMREKLALSQSDFARLIQVNVRTLQNWEQGHRRPTGPAAALLKIVAASPKAALAALER